ncbi:hypothetical protein H5410_056664 [Solanum commersonii]|uniref:Uncharacterized protein n=1 Tax=Solanum commersonii TaxID=4109 RepID=A0A9J5WLZ4_SOLCO|nr:hypothetical protein H5410_056664 [Solanum commersonii]
MIHSLELNLMRKLKNSGDPNPNLEDETLWIFNSSPSCTNLQHHLALGHWVKWYCFTELLGDVPSAPFFRRLDAFLQCSVHWKKRRSKTLRRLTKWTRQSSSLHFFVLFSPFLPFCDVVSMLFFKLQIPET